MKLACLFPGIGYTCDKPLLYYSGKMLRAMGWEVRQVPYTGFPSGIKGDREKMKAAAELALSQAEKLLQDVNWEGYEEILFVSKSVGTVVSGLYAIHHHVPCRSVLFTPVEETFQFIPGKAIVFHGTADPWARSEAVLEGCRRAGLPLFVTPGANHSLETGKVEKDIEILGETMKKVSAFIQGKAAEIQR